MSFRSFALIPIASLSACAFNAGFEQPTVVSPHAYRATVSRPVGEGVGQTTGFLYFLNQPLQSVLRIRLPKDRDFKHEGYGLQDDTAITMDRHGHLYESSCVQACILVEFDRKLQMVRTIEPNDKGELFFSLAVDNGGLLYAGNGQPYAIQVYSKSATGTAKPHRTISGDQTGLSDGAFALTIDAAGELLVSTPGAVEVFAPGANGNVAPVRIISGDQTGLNTPWNLAVGADGNVYVANQLPGSGTSFDVLVFPTNANGNVAPIRILQSGVFGRSIALGAAGEMYLGSGAINQSGAFAVYASGASGNDQPLGYVGTHYGRFNVPTAVQAALQNAWFFP